jgi:hypothetical protein
MRSNGKFVATKKGVAAALALAVYKNSELFSYSFAQLTRAVGELLDRTIAAREIREAISPETLPSCTRGHVLQARPAWSQVESKLAVGCNGSVAGWPTVTAERF